MRDLALIVGEGNPGRNATYERNKLFLHISTLPTKKLKRTFRHANVLRTQQGKILISDPNFSIMKTGVQRISTRKRKTNLIELSPGMTER